MSFATPTLGQRLDDEIKKQRIKFRFYRDYFNSGLGREKLEQNEISQNNLKSILEAIRQEFKMCLYPADYNGPLTGSAHKFRHVLTIQDHLDQLEYLKSS